MFVFMIILLTPSLSHPFRGFDFHGIPAVRRALQGAHPLFLPAVCGRQTPSIRQLFIGRLDRHLSHEIGWFCHKNVRNPHPLPERAWSNVPEGQDGGRWTGMTTVQRTNPIFEREPGRSSGRGSWIFGETKCEFQIFRISAGEISLHSPRSSIAISIPVPMAAGGWLLPSSGLLF
jgi:hypothetical protein